MNGVFGKGGNLTIEKKKRKKTCKRERGAMENKKGGHK